MKQANFIIMGAPKGGTTSLYHYLRQHPQISMGILKDSHFFLHDGASPIMGGPSDSNRQREMIKIWPDYLKQFQAAGADQVIGEIGVRYMDSPEACTRIRKRLPDVKLIAILRQPVERAYSHYRMYRANGSEPCATFEQALADEPRRLDEGWFRGVHQHLGFYHQHLQVYYEQFPNAQIRVYLFDDLKSNPTALMRDIFEFIGADSTFQPDLSTHFNQAGEIANPLVRWTWKKSRNLRSRLTPFVPVTLRGHLVRFIARRPIKPVITEPLSESTRLKLLTAYNDDIHRLSHLIDRDLSSWLK